MDKMVRDYMVRGLSDEKRLRGKGLYVKETI